MNITINNYIKGSYTIENENGEIIAEADNRITDYGMASIAGHQTSSFPNTYNNPVDFFGYFFFQLAVVTNTSPVQILVAGSNVSRNTTLIPRQDGLLQYNIVFKSSLVFGANYTITHIRTGYPYSYVCSEATLSPAVSFTKGESIIITYTLQYVTDCNKIINNMSFLTNHSNGILMPANKTNARHTPFPLYVTNSNLGGNIMNGTMCIPIGGYPSYTYDRIMLAFYSDIDIYSTMTSTTSSFTPPAKSGNDMTALYKHPLGSIKYTSSGNTWSTSLRFLFEPGQWPTTAKGFSLLSSDTDYKNTPIDNSRRSTAGIFTALQTPYNPYSKDPNMIVGLDYKFNYIRS
jgi:hypothetical protein